MFHVATISYLAVFVDCDAVVALHPALSPHGQHLWHETSRFSRYGRP